MNVNKFDALERSPEVTEQIQTIRDLPGKTEEEKLEKHERAKELRMELMLDNAALSLGSIEYMQAHPKCTEADLLEYAKASGKVVHPGVMEAYANLLINIKQQVDEVKREMFELMYDAKAPSPGPIVFKALTRSDNEGPITVEFNPLCVVVHTNYENDFKRLDNRTNVGGFFSDASVFVISDPPKSEGELLLPTGRLAPLIVIGPTDQSKSVRKHEDSHAQMSSYMLGLRFYDVWRHEEPWLHHPEVPSKQKDVWETSAPDYVVKDNLLLLANRLKKAPFEEVVETSESQRTVRMALDYALGMAKDEVLAEMNSHWGDPRGHVDDHLLKIGGVYDYFKTSLGLNPDSPTYKYLWDKYSEELEDFSSPGVHMYTLYRQHWEFWEKRLELTRHLLAQVPMKKWSEVFSKQTLFEQEIMDVTDLEGTLFEFEDTFDIPGYTLAPQELQLKERVRVARLEFLEEGTRTSDHPLITLARKTREKFEEFKTEFEENQISTAAELYQSYKRDTDEIHRRSTGALSLMSSHLKLKYKKAEAELSEDFGDVLDTLPNIPGSLSFLREFQEKAAKLRRAMLDEMSAE